MRSVLPIALALSALLPGAGGVQHRTRWFWELASGTAVAVDANRAFNGKGSIRLGVGVAANPTISFRLVGSGGLFAYDGDRFAQFFGGTDDSDALTGVGANVLAVSVEVQGSLKPWGLLQPVLGGGLGYHQRNVHGYVTSRAWVRCSTLWASTPDPDCAEFREDIDIDGGGPVLQGSAGLHLPLRNQSITLDLRYAHGMGGANAKILAVQLGFRSYL